MNWWQLLIAAYLVGAFAAVPACYEHASESMEADNPFPWWLLLILVIVMALAWPAAWLSLVIYGVRVAKARLG